MLSGLQYPRGLHVVNQSNGGSNGDEEDDENDGDVYFCEIHRDTSKQHAEHGMHGMHGEKEDEEERRMQHEKERSGMSMQSMCDRHEVQGKRRWKRWWK